MAMLLNLTLAVGVWAGAKGFDEGTRRRDVVATIVQAIPAGELGETEAEDLLFMRQEEKLARDVYLVFFELWGHWTFENISESEQRHIDAIMGLMEKYELPDPLEGNADEAGVFADEGLQALYDDLTAYGSRSLIDALLAGALIEETDIADLRESLAATDNPDIEMVYQNLMKGSRNHLRAFASQLAILGTPYSPTVLSEEDYQAIIESSPERGPVDESGESLFPEAWIGKSGGSGRLGGGTGICPNSATDETVADGLDN